MEKALLFSAQDALFNIEDFLSKGREKNGEGHKADVIACWMWNAVGSNCQLRREFPSISTTKFLLFFKLRVGYLPLNVKRTVPGQTVYNNCTLRTHHAFPHSPTVSADRSPATRILHADLDPTFMERYLAACQKQRCSKFYDRPRPANYVVGNHKVACRDVTCRS